MDSFPYTIRNRVKMSGSSHLEKSGPNLGRRRCSFAVDTDLVNKAQLIIDTSHIDSPLWMTIGVTNGMQPSNYPETKEKSLELPGQDFTRAGEVDTYVAGVPNSH